MKLRRSATVAILVVLIRLLPATALHAQESSDMSQGLKSYGVYSGSELDSVDATNAKLAVHIPLWAYSQRGDRLHLSYTIHFDSPAFRLVSDGQGGMLWQSTATLQDMDRALVVGTAAPVLSEKQITDSHGTYLYSTFAVIDPDGASHTMGAIPTSGAPTTRLYAVDSSGYYADVSTWSHQILYDAHGNIYDKNAGTSKDANNNIITQTVIGGAITDTIGRSLPALPTPAVNSCLAWSPPGQGGTVTLQFCYDGNRRLTSVELPNGTSYQFTYEPYVFDQNQGGQGVELKQIILPTGGKITYSWETHEGTCVGSTAIRTLASRVVNDGTTDRTWTYSWAVSGNTRTITVTDPMNNQTVHTVTQYGSNACYFYETQMQQKDSGSVIKTVTTTYTTNTAPSVLPASVTTALNSQSSNKTYQYGAHVTYALKASKTNGSQWAPDGTGYMTGNPYIVQDYDYGGSLLRTTTTYYKAFPSNSFVNVCNSGDVYCTENLLNLKDTEVVSGAGGNSSSTTYTYDEGGVNGTPGNLTSVHRALNYPSNKDIVDRFSYTSQGMVAQKTDPLGNATGYTYDHTNMNLKSVQEAIASHFTQYNYDPNTGVLNWVKDPNGQVKSYTYDSMNRIHRVTYPDTGYVQYDFTDVALDSSLQITTSIQSGAIKTETAYLDGLGRETRSILNDPEGNDTVVTTYDGLGRKASVTNPYRSGDTVYTTQYQYDALNRPRATIQPDNASIQYGYSGNTSTVTDEGGRSRKSQFDGLGRMTKVWEDPSGLNYETDYVFDCLGNVTGVTQNGSRGRSFSYDTLSRMYQSANPESGTIAYGYDDAGALISKGDGRGITVAYNRDALHRVTSKSYSNGEQSILYCYDNVQSACGTPSVSNGIARRTGMNDLSGTTAWSYDSMGRVLTETKTISGVSKSLSYTYNLDGSVATETYPDTSVAAYQYSDAGRALSVEDVNGSHNWAGGAKYSSAGQLTDLTLGSNTGFAGITLHDQYNSRLQPSGLMAANPTGTMFNLSYNYVLNFPNNGDVQQITNNLDSTRSQTFGYDSLNRLHTASFYGGSDRYDYDAWGNLTAKTVTGGTGEIFSNSSDSNNRLQGWGYDLAGNLVGGGSQYNNFNAESQWIYVSVTNSSYLYDGDGLKVKTSGGASGTTIYWHDQFGQVVSETDQTGNINNNYIFLNGQSVAWIDIGHGVPTKYYYYIHDHLGTTRMIATQTGSACYDADFYPWGGEAYVRTNTCFQSYKFTGKERDPDTNSTDYFGARWYQGAIARFYTPDWSATVEPTPYARLGNPQTLNLYSFVGNNPVSLRDLDGHDFIGMGGGGIGIEGDGGQGNPAPPDAQTKTAVDEQATQNQHTLTVTYVSGQGNNFEGHVVVSVDGGSQVGFGPQQPLTNTQLLEEGTGLDGSGTPGAIEPRAPSSDTKDQVTLHLTSDQAAAASKAIDDRKNNPGNYHLTTRNCAEFAESVVRAAGIPAPKDIKPASLVLDLRKEQQTGIAP